MRRAQAVCGYTCRRITLRVGPDRPAAPARQIATRVPAIRMVMLSGFAEPGTVREAVRIGVGGFLLKYQRTDHLLTAIRVVAGGGTIIDPVLAGSAEAADPHPPHDEQ